MTSENFSNLPSELIALIFSYLDKDSKLKGRCVSLKWRQLLDHYFFKAVILLTNKSMPYVQRCNCDLQVETLKIRNLTRKFPKQPLSMTRNGLAKNPKNLIFIRKATKNLTRKSISSVNIKKIFVLNRHVEFIHFDFNSMACNNFSKIRGLHFKNLKQLKICINPRPDERQNFLHLSKLKLPVLEVVQILARFETDRHENARLYIDIYSFVAQHRSTLKIVNLIHPICGKPARDSDPPLMQPDQLSLLRFQLAQVHLQRIYINFDKNEGFRDYNLGFHLLQSQDQLRTLHLNFRENNQIFLSKIDKVLLSNFETLNVVNVISNKRLGLPATFGTFLNPLSLCSHLHHLRIVNFLIPALPPNLPSSIKTLLVWGQLGGIEILQQVDACLPNLEQMDFLDLNSNQVGNDVLAVKLKFLIQMKNLKKIHWYKANFDLNNLQCLSEESRVVVEPFIIYSSWSWPLKRTLLMDAHVITIDYS